MKTPSIPTPMSFISRYTRFSPLHPAALAFLAALVLAPAELRAVDGTWTGTGSDGEWNNASNWTAIPGATSGVTNPDFAAFDAAVTPFLPVVVDTGRNLRSIRFDLAAGSFTIGSTGGNALTLSSSGTVAIQSTLAGSNITQTINAPLILAPTGTTATGSYSFSNNSGTATNRLLFGGSISGGTTTQAVTLTLAGTNTGNNEITGSLSNGGAAAGLAVAKSAAGTWTLSGSNSHSGGTSLTAGRLNLNHAAALGTGAFTINGSTSLGNTSGADLTLSTNNAISIVTGFNYRGPNSLNLGTGNVSLTAAGFRFIVISGSGTDLTIGGVISGAGGLDIQPGGGSNSSLTLSGSNSFTGGVTISGGASTRLNLNHASAVGSGTMTMVGFSILNNTSGSAMTLSNNNNVLMAGALTFAGTNSLNFGTGNVRVQAGVHRIQVLANTLTFGGSITNGTSAGGLSKHSAGTLVLSGSNTFTSGVMLEGGTLVIGQRTSLGTGNLTTQQTGGQPIAGGILEASNDLSGANAVANNIFLSVGNLQMNLTIGGSNNMTFTGSLTNAANTTLSNTNVAATLFNGPVFLSEVSGTGRTLTLGGNQSFTIAGAIANFNGSGTAGNLVITNTGTVSLTSATSSYSGSTTVSSSGSVLVVTKLANGGSDSSIGSSSNARGNLLLQNASTLRYTGAGDSTDRLFTITATGTGHGATLDASGSGAINFTNSGSLALGTNNQTRILVLTGSNTGNNTLAATLADNGSETTSVTKNGTGTWVLSAANTYNGATAVNAGTLVISAGNINNSAVTVAAGAELRYNSSTARSNFSNLTLSGNGSANRATLSGTGSINRALVLNNLGDTLSPGNSPGIQGFGVTQTWASFTYLWETNNFTGTTAGTDFDQIVITGGLTLSGGLGAYQLDLYSLTAGNVAGDVPNFAEVSRSWSILTTTAGISGFNDANWAILTTNFASSPTWLGTWAITQSGNDLLLNYTAIPEPSTLALLAIGAGAVLLRRRRRPECPANRG